MEAALRTGYEKLTGQELEEVVFDEVRGVERVNEGSVDLAGSVINIGAANGLQNAKTLHEWPHKRYEPKHPRGVR